MIQVSHLTKMYGSRPAVQDLSFHVKKGEIVGFLGPNGAGKSTTMKILTGFMPASEGTAKVAGFDVFDQSLDVKKNVGYLPETPPVYMEMIVREYLEFAAKLHGVENIKLKTAVDWAIEKTNLGDVRHRLIGNLSKGYRQRVGLAQALAHNPQVLILDEPTVGLDPKQIIEIRQLIKELASEHTIILSTHILPEVTATCQRIIIINNGKIVAQDSLDQVTSRLKKGLIFSMTVKHITPGSMETIRQIQGIQTITGNGDKIVIEIQQGCPEIRDQIIAKAVQSGLAILEFGAERVSLEEIFLQLTTEESHA